MLISLSKGTAAEQTLASPPKEKDSSEAESDEDVDLDLDGDVDSEDVVKDIKDMVKNEEEVVSMRKERIYWNWKRRKKKEVAFKEQLEVKIATTEDSAKEKTDSGTTPMDYTCTSGTSMGESTSASGSQDLSSQQSTSNISVLGYTSSTISSSENPVLVTGEDDEGRQGGRKEVRKLSDEEEAALVSGQEEGVPKKTEREQAGSPQEEEEKMELDVAVEMESDVEWEIEDVA
ncbi:MAG: hypothetical protein GY820_44435, partial [Gammaproteobacteria bacterium]|nr:hypothetical protein [Gammaproteobacteria bacterium]